MRTDSPWLTAGTISGRLSRQELFWQLSRGYLAGGWLLARSRPGAVQERPRPFFSLHVERLRPRDLAIGPGGDLVDAGFGLPQQLLAAPLQGLAALIDGDRFLQRHLALLEPLDDRFQLFDRALEGEGLDVRLVVFGHVVFPDAPRSVRLSAESNA